jgi:hypothetical protein
MLRFFGNDVLLYKIVSLDLNVKAATRLQIVCEMFVEY